MEMVELLILQEEYYLAYKKENRPEEFAVCAREEAIKMRDEIRAAVK